MKYTVRVFRSLAIVALFGACAGIAQAQTLGEAAKREAERRARIKETPKVFTNADLEALPSRGAAPAAARPDVVLPPVAAEPSVTEPAAPAATTEGAAAALPAPRVRRDEQHWRERAKVIRDRLTRLQSDAAALDGRVKALNVEIDAASASERTALAGELTQTSAALARVQEELRLIQGEWRAFENRAAEAKVPPAWIR